MVGGGGVLGCVRGKSKKEDRPQNPCAGDARPNTVDVRTKRKLPYGQFFHTISTRLRTVFRYRRPSSAC